MIRSEYRFLNRARLTALVLVTGGVLGLLAACSSDGGNAVPSSPPPITTGGGGSAGSSIGDAGTGASTEPADGGANSRGGTSSSGGTSSGAGATSRAGSSNGGGAHAGSGPVSDGGEGGEAATGDAGAPPVGRDCPKTDQGFLNAPSPVTTQKSKFDNVKRLGAHATLPPLPS